MEVINNNILSQNVDILNNSFDNFYPNLIDEKNSFDNSFPKKENEQNYCDDSFQKTYNEIYKVDIWTSTSNFTDYHKSIFDHNGLNQEPKLNIFLISDEELFSTEKIKYYNVANNFEVDENSKDKSMMVYSYSNKNYPSNNSKKEKLDNNDLQNEANINENIIQEKKNQNGNQYNNIEVVIKKENQKEVKNNNINKFDVLFCFEPKLGLDNIDIEQKQLRDLVFKNINKKNEKDNNNSLLNKNNKFVITKEKIKNDLRQRKFKSDDIIKKIKARFLKSLKKSINIKLEMANSQYLFDFLPQCFICSITKKRNDLSVLNMTFKEMMSKDFYEEYIKEEEEEKDINNKMLKKKKGKEKENKKNNEKPDKKIELKGKKKKKKNTGKKAELHPDKKKFEKNLEVIQYLENNKEISKKVNFDKIKNMKFSELFNEYLKSKEFEDDILKLKKEDDESQEYINEYIIKAINYIKYFSKSN